MKICTKCNIEKDENCFSFRDKEKLQLRAVCKTCMSINSKKYYQKNKETFKSKNKKYRGGNKEKIAKKKKEHYKENKKQISKKQKNYREENKEKIKIQKKKHYQKNKEYYLLHQKQINIKNKKSIQIYKNKYIKIRKENDPAYKLRMNTSTLVYQGLKDRGGSKKGNSFFKFMGFTGKELMYHLMNHPQREWWMHENNQGSYRPDLWDDNDPSTWVWQLDHIIPHSEFNYTSMDDPEFKRCWSLENLRPYSAKQNIIDGSNRTRHKNKGNKK